MKLSEAKFAALAVAILGLAGSACHAQAVSAAADQPSLTADAAPTEPNDDAKRRVANAQSELTRKSMRKPKAQRDAVTLAWQASRVAPTSMADAFDQPQSAQTYFLAKRLPSDQTTLSPEMYSAALKKAAAMPVFSSKQGHFMSVPRARAASVSTPSSPSASRLVGISSVGTSGALSSAWEALGPGNIGGRTRSLLIHPVNTDTMWAGSVAGGIWKTTNGGATWVPKADLLINMAVNTMVMDPRNPDILFAGTGEGFFNVDAVRGAGILKSTDGGESWTQLPGTATPDFYYVQKMVVSKANGSRMYAATRAGVFKTIDAGATWTKVIDGTGVNGCMDLAIQTDRAIPYVFASCGTFTQATVYRALDTAAAGASFTSVMSVPNQGRTSLAVAPSNQNIVYAVAASIATDGVLGVYRSTTSGAAGSFVQRLDQSAGNPNRILNGLLFTNPVIAQLTACGFGTSSSSAQGWYDNLIAVDPKNPDIVWVGGIDLFRSDDGGQNFGQASHWWFTKGVDPEYNHADHHSVVFHPGYDGVSNKTMFSTNDGGIHKTVDARKGVAYSPAPITPVSPVCGNTDTATLVNWTQLNNGYQVTQFYHGAHYPSGNTVFGGTQDNGTLRGDVGASNAWATIKGGDGGYVAVNPANTSMLWAENTGLSIQRSTNGGVSYGGFTSGITEAAGNFMFITPFAQDPTNPANMWIGGARPWRTTQATAVPTSGNIWSNAGAFFGSRVTAIAVAPSDSNRVYFGVGSGGGAVNGTVFSQAAALSSTSTTVWPSSKPRADANVISWLAVHPTTPNTVYATVSTFNTATGVGHIFKSVDGGATWANIDGSGSTGIPDVPVHCIVIDPNDTNRLYVGTDIGVFVSVDGGANWARENTGFANVIVESLSLKNDAGQRYLYAYTHGRSAYRVALP